MRRSYRQHRGYGLSNFSFSHMMGVRLVAYVMIPIWRLVQLASAAAAATLLIRLISVAADRDDVALVQQTAKDRGGDYKVAGDRAHSPTLRWLVTRIRPSRLIKTDARHWASNGKYLSSSMITSFELEDRARLSSSPPSLRPLASCVMMR